jgi:glycosidase
MSLRRCRRVAALAWLAAAAPALAMAAGPACIADPLGGRSLHLRGSFNSWNATEAHRFTWACRRWELVTRLQGEHVFKLADEGWSADADFGGPRGTTTALASPVAATAAGAPADADPAADPAALTALPLPLVLRGGELRRRFTGPTRITLTMDPADTAPRLHIEGCPEAPPLGDTVLYLRGSMNNWAALDRFAFQWSCDAYYLNVALQGRHEFKVADAAWVAATTIGDTPPGQTPPRNFVLDFDGEQTLRLAWAGGQPRLSLGPRSFADPQAPAVTDPVALSLAFDSRDLRHKSPFGAIVPGTTVRFAVDAAPGVQALTLVVEQRLLEGNQERLAYTPLARVPMRAQAAAGGRFTWTAEHRFDAVAVHGYWFEAEIAGRRFVLQNNREPVYWTRENGTGGVATVGDRPAADGAIRRLRQTVFAADFRVPDWAPDIVYYYIFPERFRNGDRGNDPQPGVARYRSGTVERHARWLERPFRPGSGDGSDDVFNNDFFGGDLAGITEKLDHIAALGANTIYMTPIFRAGSNHKYDHADYLNVDPGFGSNADFERLARQAATRGIRIVLDASFNHTGSDSIYFDRYGHFGGTGAFAGGRPNPASPYAGWYRLDPQATTPERAYIGWVGNTDLPELDKASPGWRQFAFGAPGGGNPDTPYGVTQTWLDRGAAGWRMDVAPWVSDDFWRGWRAAVKAHRPDAITVAETWFDASKYFLGDMFDSTMNYIFRNAVLDYAAGGPAQAMVGNLEHLREAYPPQAHAALMNLLSGHDTARSLHLLGWADGSTDAQAEALAKARLRLAMLVQMTYPGAPAVYYGDEVGLNGAEDPYNRMPFPWPDEGGRPDLALLADVQRLIALRHAQPALRRGTLAAPLHVDANVVVWLRRLGTTWALVAVNNAAQPARVRVALPAGAPATLGDALSTDAAAVLREGDGVWIDVPARFGRVLVGEGDAAVAR